MEINGWRLYHHPLFKHQLDKLLSEAERIQAQEPETYKNHPKVKLLARIVQLITDEIPDDPTHAKYNQGNTLGNDYRHWKRAKFGKDKRYRLFFRYDAKTREKGKGRAIIYAWVNDEKTLRKEGDKNDPYAIFARGLVRGEPPDSLEQLLKQSDELELNFKEEE